MKTLFLALAIVFAPSLAAAQVTASLAGGFGSWSMKSMKAWQRNYLESFPVEAATIADYPGHYFFEIAVTQQKSKWIRGVSISTGNTGGRIYYSDYSGKISMDQDLSFFLISGHVGRTLNREGAKFMLTASLRPGVALSNMDYVYERIIYDSDTEELTNRFTALNLSVQPTFSVSRMFGILGVEAQAGYLLPVVNGKLTYEDETKIPPQERNVDYLTYGKQIPVKADWRGYRMSLCLLFRIK